MGNNPSRNHAGENGNRRGASQECRPKTIVCQNPMQTFCDCLEACTNPVYTQIILLFQSKETGNFRQGLEYVILGQRENVTRHDGTSLQVEVAMDRVNRRLFGL
ncbi:uncharacterized protein LOC135480191 [Liolophura sinensis]|uniref:uncharacterized protein LOC135480191 n=1 Tax=Liolophura sinensis TaxID=3198878 RepID=UPI0031590827